MTQDRRSSRGTFADRLAAARRRTFVGRAEEMALFRSALEEGESRIFFIHGPGGIGKTTLLSEFGREAGERGLRFVWLDGRGIEASPPGFIGALHGALGLAPDVPTIEYVSASDLRVLFVDTFEAVAQLDGWLREDFLPRLPGGTVLVLAGREPPSAGWRADAGLREICTTIALRNLRPEESRAYLEARGLGGRADTDALEFTHGHPLALSLVADLMTLTGEQSVRPTESPHLISDLLQRFVEHVPSPRHREALEICAHARVTTEALLRAVMGGDDEHELFEWLRGVSFIEQGPEGLFPHDLARDVLDFDLRWRDPERFQDLHRRIRAYALYQLEEASGPAKQPAFYSLLFMHRHSPVIKPFYEWRALGGYFMEKARPEDHEAILEMVRHFEGDDSAAIASYWLERQPEAFCVFRAIGDPTPQGVVASLILQTPASEDLEADPALRNVWSYIRRAGPLRQGECFMLSRFTMSRDGYQDTLALNFVSTASMVLYLTTPNLAWDVAAVVDIEHWTPALTYFDFRRVEEADYQIGNRRYGVFVHDWRVKPLSAWLDLLAEREIDDNLTLEAMQSQQAPQLLVMSEPDFREAVRQALRDFRRPDALAANPLLRSRLVRDSAGSTDPADTLQSLIIEGASVLKGNPRDQRLYRALLHTYLEPAPTQEAAAESLDLPFSTYRRHLASGIERLTAWLWARELGG